METPNFDDIRPYVDAEIPAALARIAQSELIPQVLRFIYPQAKVEDSLQRLRQVNTVRELQTTFMRDAIERILETTSTGFTASGFEHIKRGHPYLYVSNHRDITLDAFLLQKVFIDRLSDTSYIVFGNNLIDTPLMKDLFLSNKLIQMERGGNPMAFYRSLQHLSQYLHKIITEEHQSVWIAQKNGRSKDGIDSTAPALASVAPYTRREMRADIIAPAHIGHGSSVTYSVQPVRRQRESFRPASRIARISACAVASRSASHILCARTTTPPSSSMRTAPTGTSPDSIARRASSKAIAIYSRSLFMKQISYPFQNRPVLIEKRLRRARHVYYICFGRTGFVCLGRRQRLPPRLHLLVQHLTK